MRPADTSAAAHEVQTAILRRLGPDARLALGFELTELSRKLLAAGIRSRHPEYGEEQVRLAAIRLWLGDELYRRAYPRSPVLAP